MYDLNTKNDFSIDVVIVCHGSILVPSEKVIKQEDIWLLNVETHGSRDHGSKSASHGQILLSALWWEHRDLSRESREILV